MNCQKSELEDALLRENEYKKKIESLRTALYSKGQNSALLQNVIHHFLNAIVVFFVTL